MRAQEPLENYMKRRIHLVIVAIFFCILNFSSAVSPQSVSRPDRGSGAIVPYDSSGIENINLHNGNLALSIPLASLPPMAGGKLGFTIYAQYNSKLWDTYVQQRVRRQPGDYPAYYDVSKPSESGYGGWGIGGSYGLDYEDAELDYERVLDSLGEGDRILFRDYNWVKTFFVTPDGSRHEIRPHWAQPFWGADDFYRGYYKDTPDVTGNAMRYYTVDGSYIWLTIYPSTSTEILWEANLPDGTKIKQFTGNVQRIIDTNGNKVKRYLVGQEIRYQDEQTGREIKIGFNSTTGNTEVSYQTVGGTWQVIEVIGGTTSVSGKFYNVDFPDLSGNPGCTYQEPSSGNIYDPQIISVIREIKFPQTESGQPAPTYAFSYNSDSVDSNSVTYYNAGCPTIPQPQTFNNPSKGFGELSEMVRPGGAIHKYSYLLDTTHIVGGSSANSAINAASNTITQKQVVHDGVTDTWTYGVSENGASVTNPDGSTINLQMNTHFTSQSSTNGGMDGAAGVVYRETRSNNIRIERRWARKVFDGAYDITSGYQKLSFNPVVTHEFTSLLDDNGNPVKMSAKTFQYDFNGNVLQTVEYDWFDPGLVSRDSTTSVPLAVPANATVLRTTNNTYHNSPTTAASADVYAKTSYSILNAVKETTIGPSITQFSYDNQAFGIAPANGNVTKVSSWDNVNNQFIHSLTGYDSYGNVISKTDPKGNVTQISYGDNTHAMPTSTTVDPQNGTGVQTASTTYDYYTGLPLTSIDINGNVSSIDYTNHLLGAIDPFGRPGTAYSPYINIEGVNKRQTVKTYYDDNARQTRIETDLFNEGDALLKTRVSHDQLGRMILTEKNENGSSVYSIFAETVYKTQDRVVMTSNPRRGTASSTDGWTRVTSDLLGRPIESATFSGAAQPPITGTNGNITGLASSEYSTNATTVTDQAGKQGRSITNALGQLTRVDEPNTVGQLGAVASPNQPTNYTYDALGNLTQIIQGGQTRTFTYSSLSRLLTSTNPESGTFQHTYDPNGNLLTKKDARNITTTYTYDVMNRVTFRDYSDSTPDITYTYDDSQVPFSKGKLTKVASSISETSYLSFDVQDRITASRQRTYGNDYNFSYTYNLDGDLVTQTYPSGKVVKFDYDASGDLAQVGKLTANGTQVYANSFGYAPHGQVEKVRLGNGKWETTKFNSSRQITEIGLGHSATDTGLWKANYEYGEWNGTAIDPLKNNGNLARQTINVPTIGTATGFTAIQTYSYDTLDRVKSATEKVGETQTWKQTFLYDRFGNKNFDVPNTTTLGLCAAAVCNPTANPANNRLVDYGYDNAGNITTDAESRTFGYDAENRQITASGNNLSMSYAYDGNGKRVKSHNAVTDQTTIFVYDADGKLAAEYTINVPPPTTPTISYLTEDALGSVRITTNSFGEVKARRDFLPFGDELYAGIGNRNTNQKYSSNNDDTRQKFATYQRDIETGLDFAQSRYYSPALGRFTSPDEFKGGPDELFDFEEDASDNPTFYADLENPQSLNKYQYGYNNPYKFNDPSGHCPPVASCLQNPALADKVNRLTDAVTKSAVGVAVAGWVTAATDVAVNSLQQSANAGIGDASCPACTSSQRMGQSYMSKSSSPAPQRGSGQGNIATAKAQVGGSTKAANSKKAAQQGIPKNKLGPSGKAKIHVVRHPTQKRAKDAARNEGQGKPARDNNPKKGGSHYHPTNKDGSRKKGKDNVHHEFPLKKGRLPE